MHGNLIVSRRLPDLRDDLIQSRTHLHLRCLNILRRIRKRCFLPQIFPVISGSVGMPVLGIIKTKLPKTGEIKKTHRIADRHDTHILRIIGYFRGNVRRNLFPVDFKTSRPQNDGLLSCAEIFDQCIDQFFLVSNRSEFYFIIYDNPEEKTCTCQHDCRENCGSPLHDFFQIYPLLRSLPAFTGVRFSAAAPDSRAEIVRLPP